MKRIFTWLKTSGKKLAVPVILAVLLLGTSITAIAEGSYILQMNNGVWENKQSKGAIHYKAADGNEVVFDSSDLDALAQNIAENKNSITNMSAVARTGSFNDLLDKPEFPAVDSALDKNSNNAISNKAVAGSIESLNNNLADISLRYDSVSGKPQWKERGADTWSNFNSKPVLVGTYSGNQTIDVSDYIGVGITEGNFIVEFVSNSEARGTTGVVWEDPSGTSVRINQTSMSKSLSGNNLVISGMSIAGDLGTCWSGQWNFGSPGRLASSTITYKVWFVG